MKLRKNPLTPVGVRGSVFDYELQESVRAALLVDVPADIVGAVPAGNHRLFVAINARFFHLCIKNMKKGGFAASFGIVYISFLLNRLFQTLHSGRMPPQ